MKDLGTKFLALGRQLIWWLDSVGYAFIDDTYNLMMAMISGFNADTIADISGKIITNCYFLVGIFAFFKIAIILVESMINPDKLTDKKYGVSKYFVNFIVAIALLIAVPLIFDGSRKLQNLIVTKNVIPNIILNTKLEGGNASSAIQLASIKALIHPDDRLAELVTTQNDVEGDDYNVGDYKPLDVCESESCQNAIEAWNKNYLRARTVDKFIAVYEKVEKNDIEEKIFAYDYKAFIPLIVGVFITYVFLSFAIDIGVRSVELVCLEILSPVFIVTYVDPKMAENGPFKKWLDACLKSYGSLFIRIGIISFMLLLISNLNALLGSINSDLGFFAKLLLIICILIFAKKAPKWIGDMFGLADGAGLGGLGIGKKLGGAALVGGGINKGLESAKKYTGQKAKNFGANRIRNTAARLGGMHEAAKENRNNKNDPNAKKKSVWGAGRAAAKQSRAANWGQDAQGLGKDISGGWQAGRKNQNPNAESLGDKLKGKAVIAANLQNDKIGNTDAARKDAIDNAAANKMFPGAKLTSTTKRTDEIKGKFPSSAKEMNEAWDAPKTEDEAYSKLGEKLGFTVSHDGQGGITFSRDGTSFNLDEFKKQNVSETGQLAIKSLIADNANKYVSDYQNALQQQEAASTNVSSKAADIMKVQTGLRLTNPDYANARTEIDNYNSKVEKREALVNEINGYHSSNDYKMLESMAANEPSKMSENDKARWNGYQNQTKEYITMIDNINTELHNEKANYNNNQAIVAGIESKTGIKQMQEDLKISQERLKEWTKEVEEHKETFKSFASKDDNPYAVKIDGVKFTPLDGTKLNNVSAALQEKANKAKSEFDKKMNDNKEEK